MKNDKQKQELLNKIEELKKQVENLDKPQFEMGKPYKLIEDYACLKKGEVYKIIEYQTNDKFCITVNHIMFGIREREEEENYLSPYVEILIPATTDEWKEALINHAKKTGFKEGVWINKKGVSNWIEDVKLDSNDMFHYNEEIDELMLGMHIIYLKGKWAKILPDEKIYVGDNEVGFDKGFCVINGCCFVQSEIEALLLSNPELFGKILSKMK